MSLFTSFEVLASGMRAQRARMNIITSNLTNAQSTKTEDGGPYRRLDPLFQAVQVGGENFESTLGGAVKGVQVADVVPDSRPFQEVHDPGHPDADANGYVLYPNVNTVEEMVDLMTAARSFEANTQAFQTVRTSILRALEIGR
jgi:flagellar basal-body rod protein FlgC